MGTERPATRATDREYTRREVLMAFRRAEVPLLTAPEVAESLGCSAPTARDRLEELVEDGRLHRKEVGARAVVYALAAGEVGTE